MPTLNGYVCFYHGKRHELHAETSYEAQQQAAAFFKVKPNKTYQITVVLAEKDGEPVTHIAVD